MQKSCCRGYGTSVKLLFKLRDPSIKKKKKNRFRIVHKLFILFLFLFFVRVRRKRRGDDRQHSIIVLIWIHDVRFTFSVRVRTCCARFWIVYDRMKR